MRNLDTKVKIGGVAMARWIAGRDCYDSEFDPGHGYIVHQSLPRFTARWCTGDGPLRPLTYAATDEDGTTLLSFYDFVWIDDLPAEADFESLMQDATEALSRFIERLNEEYE